MIEKTQGPQTTDHRPQTTVLVGWMGVVVLLVSVGCRSTKPLPSVCIQGHCVQVELADTPQERERGLMFRDSLPQDQGMLFIFDTPGEYGFWMKNTKIPLDMIWLSEERRVVAIHENVPPCTADPCPVYEPHAQAKYVLEVNPGWVQSNKIVVESN